MISAAVQSRLTWAGLALAIATVASLPGAYAQPMVDYESISLINLIATPERYEKKKVVVSGWINLNLEDMTLCLAKVVPSGKECVWIELEDGNMEAFKKRLSQWQQHDGKLVVVHGVFNKENQGHFGGSSGALEKIERITPSHSQRSKAKK